MLKRDMVETDGSVVYLLLIKVQSARIERDSEFECAKDVREKMPLALFRVIDDMLAL